VAIASKYLTMMNMQNISCEHENNNKGSIF